MLQHELNEGAAPSETSGSSPNALKFSRYAVVPQEFVGRGSLFLL